MISYKIRLTWIALTLGGLLVWGLAIIGANCLFRDAPATAFENLQ